MKTNKRKKGIQAFDEGLKRTFEKAVEAGEVITRYSDIERSGRRTEWICDHGIGHHKGVHGCDGCCSKAPKDMWDKVSSDKEYSKTDHTHCFDIKNPPCSLQVRHRCCLCGEPVPESGKEKKYDFIWNGKLHRCKYEDHEGFGPCNFCEVVESDKGVCGIMLHTRGFGAGKGAVYCAETKPCKFHGSDKPGVIETIGDAKKIVDNLKEQIEKKGVNHEKDTYLVIPKDVWESGKEEFEKSEKRMISERNILVYSRKEWLSFGYWTEKELDNADKNGYIGMKHGVDCYLARPIPWVAENTLEGWTGGLMNVLNDCHHKFEYDREINHLKSFIRQLLADKEEEVRKEIAKMVESMKGKYGVTEYRVMDFNDVLSDVASRIRSNKK
jgi:hypothetical protein